MPIIARFPPFPEELSSPPPPPPSPGSIEWGGGGIGEVEGEEGANIGSLAPSVKREERCSFSPPPPQ